MQLTNPLIFLSKALEGNFAQTPKGIRYYNGALGRIKTFKATNISLISLAFNYPLKRYLC